MKILVLDDSQERLDIFKSNIETNLKIDNVDYVKTSDEAIELLKNNNDYEIVFLDHDLGGLQMEWQEENCGMNVVDWIISNSYTKNCVYVIHSFNYPRGLEMYSRLKDAGYNVAHSPGIWQKKFC
jgi:CheY-like chemotaxis protein